MTVFLFDDFENQNFDKWTYTQGNPSITASPCSGNHAAMFTATEPSLCNLVKEGLNAKDFYVEALVYFDVLPNVLTRLFECRNSSWVKLGYCAMIPDHTLQVKIQDGRFVNGTTPLEAGKCHRIQFRRYADATNGVLQVWLDGNLEAELYDNTLADNTGILYAGLPWASGAMTLIMDDITLADEKILPQFESQVSCEVLDMDTAGEFQVFLNGTQIYSCPNNAENNDVWAGLVVELPEAQLVVGTNTLRITNPLGAYCRSRNLQIKLNGEVVVEDAVEHTLTGGAEVIYNFTVASQTQFSCQAFDMDTAGELQLTLNGNLVYSAPNNAANNEIYVDLAVDLTEFVVQGTNTLVVSNPTGAYCRVRNILVTVDGEIVVNDATERTLQNGASVSYTFNYGELPTMFELGTAQSGVSYPRLETDPVVQNVVYAVSSILYKKLTAEEVANLQAAVQQKLGNYVDHIRMTYAKYENWGYYFQFDSDQDNLKTVGDIISEVTNDPLLNANGNYITKINVYTNVEELPGGNQYVTPISLDLDVGTYEITVPQTVIINSVTYVFNRWEDGTTNLVRTVYLTDNMILNAIYSGGLSFTIVIDSNPTGVSLINPDAVTPTSVSIIDGQNITVQAPTIIDWAPSQVPTFLEKFYSGRSESSTFSDFKYARAQTFADIELDGSLTPTTDFNRYLYGGINWSRLKIGWDQVLAQNRILILGIWVTNFEELQQQSIDNFFAQLQAEAEARDTYVIWLPCWEFNQEHTKDNPWGLNIADSPRMWYLEPSIYAEKMAMMRQSIDSHNFDRILLGTAPDSLVRYTWDRPFDAAWTGYASSSGMIWVLEPYLEGMAHADVIGASMYCWDWFTGYGDSQETKDLANRGTYDLAFLEACFNKMHDIRDYIDPTHTKPFFAWEFNTTCSSDMAANEFFIENSYKLVEQHFPWGLRALSWWCPLYNGMYDVCNNWARVYAGYSG